jgi:hypothetical protein
MHTYWQCKQVFELFLAGEGLTGADSHFDVTRAAECAACDSNSKAKQGKQGDEKEKVGCFQITPPSIMQSACKLSNLASCFAVIAPP